MSRRRRSAVPAAIDPERLRDERARFHRWVKPTTVACRAIKRQRSIDHGDIIAEIGHTRRRRAMAKPAAWQVPRVYNPLCGPLRCIEPALFARYVCQERQGGGGPAIFPGILVLVYARLATHGIAGGAGQ